MKKVNGYGIDLGNIFINFSWEKKVIEFFGRFLYYL